MRTARSCVDGARELDVTAWIVETEVAVGSLSIWHWFVTLVFLASPIMGIVRGVKNQSVLHALLSALIPLYGLIYFFVAKRPA